MRNLQNCKKETPLGYTLSLEDFANLDRDGKINFSHSFIYQSNYIEGISYLPYETIHGTKEEIEKAKTESKYVPEWGNHLKALKYVLENFDKPLNRERTRILHGILMEDLLPKKEVGHYRKNLCCLVSSSTPYIIGNKIFQDRKITRRCPKPKSLPYLMGHYEKDLKDLEMCSEVTADRLLKNHAYFEWIHPFADGNGRVGRLMFNWLSLRYRQEFQVIESGHRQDYYSFLKDNEEDFNKRHPRIAKETKLKS